MAHSDNGEIYAMPYEKIATMTFLDDDSALQYLPGTHLRHFLEADGSPPPGGPPHPPESKGPEVRAAHAEGRFIAANPTAGSVVFREQHFPSLSALLLSQATIACVVLQGCRPCGTPWAPSTGCGAT